MTKDRIGSFGWYLVAVFVAAVVIGVLSRVVVGYSGFWWAFGMAFLFGAIFAIMHLINSPTVKWWGTALVIALVIYNIAVAWYPGTSDGISRRSATQDIFNFSWLKPSPEENVATAIVISCRDDEDSIARWAAKELANIPTNLTVKERSAKRRAIIVQAKASLAELKKDCGDPISGLTTSDATDTGGQNTPNGSAPKAPDPNKKSFTLDPTKTWQSSGIVLKKGQTVTPNFDGCVKWDPGRACVGPDGEYYRASELDRSTDFPARLAKAGSLLMKVGNKVYHIGSGETIKITQGGTAKFMINDRRNALYDNTGSFSGTLVMN